MKIKFKGEKTLVKTNYVKIKIKQKWLFIQNLPQKESDTITAFGRAAEEGGGKS